MDTHLRGRKGRALTQRFVVQESPPPAAPNSELPLPQAAADDSESPPPAALSSRLFVGLVMRNAEIADRETDTVK
jgi:hypothetical protein